MKNGKEPLSSHFSHREIPECTRCTLSGGRYLYRPEQFSPSALVPFTTLQTIYQKGDSIDNITFTTKGLADEATNEQFEAEYRQALGLKKQFSPTDEGAIWIWNRFTQYLQQQTATQILHTAIWVIGIFTLLSGIVGVSNIMLITVRERTHEFGIRKALGAKPASILWLIISESVTITTFFGYIGMVAGIAVTEYMNQVAGKQTMDMGVFSMTFSKPDCRLVHCHRSYPDISYRRYAGRAFPSKKSSQNPTH